MISLDWKERLVKDTADFYENKLLKGDYNVGIIYNAYSVRADHGIPHEVLTFVTKELVKLIGKNADQFMEFYKYLWVEGQENGKIIVSLILAKIVSKDKDKYLELVNSFISDSDSYNDIHLLLDKVYYPLMKKSPDRYIGIAYKWLASDKLVLEQASIKLLIKFCKANKSYTKSVLRHLENKWIYASKEMLKIYAQFFKEVGKFDKALYLETFTYYENSHDPNIVELLTTSISFYDDAIEKIVEHWTKSGNARLKKSAVVSLKSLLKKKS
ncbi:MAG: hypothetical protein B6226_01365 [Candidatus Cloacimonetes bacterium 4572_65]|nr:MAG: hypothetical protein B6226_01365 [Candidatus Cloacimonetes bacterium 4572_65]